MKNFKRLISIILALTLVFGIVGTLGGCNQNDNKDAFLTRGQFTELLAATFGMDEYQQDSPYYVDVNEDNDLFPYLQSCREWDVLKRETMFHPNDKATIEFSVQAAVCSIGEISANEKDATDQALKTAQKEGIINSVDKKYLSQKIDIVFANSLIDWAVQKYQEIEIVSRNNVVLGEGVKDLTAFNEQQISVVDSKVTISGSETEYIVGDIIITPATKDDPQGVARKITAVREENGKIVYDTIEPELEEVYEELSFAGKVVPQLSDIIPAPGVTIESGAQLSPVGNISQNQPKIINLTYTNTPLDNSPNIVNLANKDGLSFTANVNFKKGTVGIDPKWNEFSLNASQLITSPNAGTASPDLGQWFSKSSVIPDKNLFGADPYDNSKDIDAYKSGKISADELKQRLENEGSTNVNGWENKPSMKNKFTGGYEITGSLKISDLYISPDIELKKAFGIPYGIDAIKIETNYKVVSTLKITGKLTEELTVFSSPIAIGATGAVVTLEFKLYAELNGELSVKATISNNTKTEYRKGNTKKVSTKDASLEAELAATLEFGPKIRAIISFLSIKIIDVDLKTGILFEAKATVVGSTKITNGTDKDMIERQTVFKTEVKGYIPIVKLSIGNHKGTLANELNIKFSWTIVGKSPATVKALDFVIWKKEFLVFYDKLLIPHVEDTTSADQQNNSSSGYPNGGLDGNIMLNDYYISLAIGGNKKLEITRMPAGYKQSDFTWTSENPDVATVDSNGNVIGKADGSTVIIVKSSDGKCQHKCAVSVSDSSNVSFTPLN